jgi:hypothetical protein
MEKSQMGDQSKNIPLLIKRENLTKILKFLEDIKFNINFYYNFLLKIIFNSNNKYNFWKVIQNNNK